MRCGISCSHANISAITFFVSLNLSGGNCPRRRWIRCRSTEPRPDRLTTHGLASQGGFGNGISLSPPRTSVVSGATMETVRSLSGLAHKTKQGRTMATIPRSTSTMSPFSGQFVIQNCRGRPEVVPDFLQGLVGLRDWRKRGQTIGDQVTEQVCQGFAAAICLSYEHVVIASLNPNRIGDGLHAYDLTTLAPLGKPFSTPARTVWAVCTTPEVPVFSRSTQAAWFVTSGKAAFRGSRLNSFWPLEEDGGALDW